MLPWACSCSGVLPERAVIDDGLDDAWWTKQKSFSPTKVTYVTALVMQRRHRRHYAAPLTASRDGSDLARLQHSLQLMDIPASGDSRPTRSDHGIAGHFGAKSSIWVT